MILQIITNHIFPNIVYGASYALFIWILMRLQKRIFRSNRRKINRHKVDKFLKQHNDNAEELKKLGLAILDWSGLIAFSFLKSLKILLFRTPSRYRAYRIRIIKRRRLKDDNSQIRGQLLKLGISIN